MQRERVWFSVIVPVYNVSTYLRQCLDSLVSQSFKVFELIIVDDGSTDGSSEICDEYAKKFDFIHVIHRKNGGLSAARNSGLQVANGKYVVFVDSDDYIERTSLEIFYNITQENPVDVVAAYGYKLMPGGKCEINREFRKGYDSVTSGIDYFSNTLHQNTYAAASVYNIVKLRVIKEYHLSFKEGLLHEDELWTPVLLCHCKSVIDLKFRFYYYRTSNITSITRNPELSERRAMSRIELSRILAKKYENDSSCHVPAFGDNIAAQYMYGVYIGALERDKRFKIERMFPIKYATTFKYKFKAILFGISPSLACFLRKLMSRNEKSENPVSH